MKLGTIMFLAAFFTLDWLLRKKFPGLYRRIQLPVNIAVSALALAYCALLIYALRDVLDSSLSGGDKLFFILLVALSLVAIYFMATRLWRHWLKERKTEDKK